jgi:tetratricopeptide (TPR) repeat protein
MDLVDAVALLKHPIVLLVATAVLSNYLIPRITRGWQDHQNEIQLKAAFVSDISQSVLGLVMSVQFATNYTLRTSALSASEPEALREVQSSLDESYRNWEIQSAVIGSKIRAYFPNTSNGSKWDAFAKIVSEVYALSGTTDPHYLPQRIEYLKNYFARDDVDWETLEKGPKAEDIFDVSEDLRKYERAWFSLKEAVLGRKNEIVHAILESPISSFRRPHFFDRMIHRRSGLPNLEQLEARPFQPQTRLEAAMAPASTPEELARQGATLFNNGKTEQALERYDSALQRDPTSVRVLAQRAMVLQELERYDEAEKSIRNAIALEPDNDHHWLQLGEILIDAGEFQAALEAFTRATELDPKYRPNWLGKATALENLGRMEEAQEAHQRAQA